MQACTNSTRPAQEGPRGNGVQPSCSPRRPTLLIPALTPKAPGPQPGWARSPANPRGGGRRPHEVKRTSHGPQPCAEGGACRGSEGGEREYPHGHQHQNDTLSPILQLFFGREPPKTPECPPPGQETEAQDGQCLASSSLVYTVVPLFNCKLDYVTISKKEHFFSNVYSFLRESKRA